MIKEGIGDVNCGWGNIIVDVITIFLDFLSGFLLYF